MPVFRLNTNANLIDILRSNDSGVYRDYLLDNTQSLNRLNQIILYASIIKNKNYVPFIEVKFTSKYGRREKRIEIVSKNNNEFVLYKLSKASKFDKDALELSNLIIEVKEIINNPTIKGVLLFSDKATDINFINTSIKAFTTDITAELI